MIKKTLCFSNPAYLSMRNSQLVIKLPEVEKADVLVEDFKKMNELTRPIEDIGVVVLDNKQITITQGALEALLENNCAVITCDSNHLPVGLLLPLVGNTTQNERFRDQLDASQPLRKQLWQQTMQSLFRLMHLQPMQRSRRSSSRPEQGRASLLKRLRSTGHTSLCPLPRSMQRRTL